MSSAVKEDHLKKVLYIEDNPVNIKLVKKILASRFKVRLTSSHIPELGIELAKSEKPDLIFLDINLPGMDGYQVLEIFKQDSELQKIPVVAITDNSSVLDIEKGKNAGFDDYITKPVDIKKFNHVIDQYLKI